MKKTIVREYSAKSKLSGGGNKSIARKLRLVLDHMERVLKEVRLETA